VNTDVATVGSALPGDPATVRRQAVLWYWQRISAMVLAFCVVVHLAGIVYAVRGGLSAAEILGRTRGSWGFAVFYAVFVVACAVHAPIGIANVVAEATGARGRVAGVVAQVFCALILVLGLRAIYAVVA
jgi:fumarate reductase subunit C